MSAFARALELAKRQLPAAFTVGGGLPYSDGETPRAIVPEPDEGLLADRVLDIEATIPNGTEDVGDFEDAVKEIGFEAIAFYISFHRPTPQGLWGIFYFEHRVRQFAEVVRREFQPVRCLPQVRSYREARALCGKIIAAAKPCSTPTGPDRLSTSPVCSPASTKKENTRTHAVFPPK